MLLLIIHKFLFADFAVILNEAKKSTFTKSAKTNFVMFKP